MSGNRTFSMIKPDTVKDGHIGSILKMIEGAGFKIKAIKMTRLSPQRAGEFYAVHTGKPFFEILTELMSAGPIIAMVLEKENAIQDFRKLIGATDPAKAEEGTIRKLYARSMQSNAVHGSDSDENALIESRFFFSAMEIY